MYPHLDNDNRKKFCTTKFIGFGQGGNVLCTCASDGSVTIRRHNAPLAFSTHRKHDTDSVVICAALGAGCAGDFLLTASTDGLLVVHRVDVTRITSLPDANEASLGIDPPAFRIIANSGEGKVDPVDGFPTVTPVKEVQVLTSLADAHDRSKGNSHSLQEERVKKKRGILELAAKRKKTAVRGVVANLRKEYSALVAENLALPEAARLREEQLVVDPDFSSRMKEARLEYLAQVRKECAYESERSALLREKLEKAFVSSRECEHFIVIGLKSVQRVQSLASCTLPPAFWELQSYVNEMGKGNQDAVKKEKDNASELDSGSSDGLSPGPKSQDVGGQKSETKMRSSTFEARKVSVFYRLPGHYWI